LLVTIPLAMKKSQKLSTNFFPGLALSARGSNDVLRWNDDRRLCCSHDLGTSNLAKPCSQRAQPFEAQGKQCCAPTMKRINGVSGTLTAAKVFFQRLPISQVPTRIEVPEIALWEACVVQNDGGFGVPLFQFKFHERINARIPVRRTPSLYDTLVRHQFYISSDDSSPEH